MLDDHEASAAVEANRLNWNDRTAVHVASAMYDLEGFVADPGRISAVVRDDLAVPGSASARAASWPGWISFISSAASTPTPSRWSAWVRALLALISPTNP